MTQQHDLKIWPSFYGPMQTGEKSFDIRRNDRGFQKGDTVLFREWNPDEKLYTGRVLPVMEITYVLSGWGLAPEHVALGLDRVL